MKKQAIYWWGAAALALLSLSPMAVRAQAPDPDAIDYGVLNNPYYTYADLKVAKADDLSDTEIGKLVKIAERSGTKFRTLSDAVVRGETFTMLSAKYGVPLADLENVQKQKDEVDAYCSAYETSGEYALPAAKPGTPSGKKY